MERAEEHLSNEVDTNKNSNASPAGWLRPPRPDPLGAELTLLDRRWSRPEQFRNGHNSDDLVSQGVLAPDEPAQIIDEDVDDVLFVAAGFAGGMGRDQNVRHVP